MYAGHKRVPEDNFKLFRVDFFLFGDNNFIYRALLTSYIHRELHHTLHEW